MLLVGLIVKYSRSPHLCQPLDELREHERDGPPLGHQRRRDVAERCQEEAGGQYLLPADHLGHATPRDLRQHVPKKAGAHHVVLGLGVPQEVAFWLYREEDGIV